MRWQSISIGALVSFAALSIAPASAFVFQARDDNGTLVPLRWAPGWSPIHFLMNDRPLELLPNLAPGSTPVAAIQAAMETWAIGPLRLSLAGTATNANLALDGVNLITFADTPQNRSAFGDAPTAERVFPEPTYPGLPIVESDIGLNPALPFATDGRPNAYDVQDRMTRALGSCLGLAAAPIASDVMYPFHHLGQTPRYRLSTDDIAGVRALYGLSPAPGEGAIRGQVVTDSGDPVFGAAVIAVDGEGIVQVGVLSDKQGQFTIPYLAANVYQVYAEPLDGPVTPANLGPAYASIRHDFLLEFAGGNPTPSTIKVVGGAATAIDPIRVPVRKSSVKIQAIAWSPDGHSHAPAYPQALPIQPGESRYLEITGEGLAMLDPAGITISGGVQVDAVKLQRGVSTDGTPWMIVPVTARADAPPGPRNLYLAQGDERSVLSGGIEVVAG